MDFDRPVFFDVMAYADAAEGDVVDMVSGNPDWEPPEALREGLREYADGPPADFQYPPSEGLGDLREEIATRRGVDVDRVVVTNGGGEANYLAMACGLDAFSGTETLLTDPTYPYYPDRAAMLGSEVRYVPVGPTGDLDPADVRERASEDTALVVVNSPNNPTGAVYDADTVAELVGIAEEHDALLVSDEVYDHFDYSGRFASALAVESENRVVTGSFSKSMAITGLRVGYAILPEALVGPARARHMLVNVAGSHPGQRAVLSALRDTGPEYYEANRDLLRERVRVFTDALDRAGAEYVVPDGAFYVLARFEGMEGTLDNAKRLVDETGVAGMPGDAFGETTSGWFRYALVTDRVEEAAERLAESMG
ncbi:pyridoxal phosphate-dependent aminotransferase [Halomarina litorea]|uniref:pyridoxal phosphate-dependent aminotransferase n=1 Tax=Halomarina litorea TaxID=2961595 RepID=UPI0020C55A0E|nr:pyridoxal phosphate-dependent aminotransferase [Halomarina sp. BCD28]